MYINDDDAKKLICKIGQKMYLKQFVCANDGNMSIRVSDDTIWITPTGVSKGSLKPEMMSKVNFEGIILEHGSLPVTSEIKMHLRVYKENNRIQSTCHTHAIYLSVFACAGIQVDMAISPETALIVGTIPVAEYCHPGTKDLAESIAPYIKDYHEVLLANHGALTWGEKPEEAWFRMEAAEAYCKTCILLMNTIGRVRLLSKKQLAELFALQNVPINKSMVRGIEDEKNNPQVISLTDLFKDRLGKINTNLT